MSVESIKAAAGSALVQVGAAIQAGREWLGKTVSWLYDTVVSFDIPGKLYALGHFLITNLGKIIDWAARNVSIAWRYSRDFCTRTFSWGAAKTGALRQTTVQEGKRALSYSSRQLASASQATGAFLATNVGIASAAGPLSLTALFYASFYAENKALKTSLLIVGACGLVLTGAALASPTPLLLCLV